ncbi:hypothetical protein COV24_03695, partial [candidate division WWE3 bacterium CG10_big_fil_rev_8_21_14_0_10_32_10]
MKLSLFFKKIFKYKYFLFLLILVFILATVNHVSNTWLLGWDSLSDEFNFKINFIRQFAGIWNEYQGLGTAGGHAHASDFPRFIYLFVSSLFFPRQFLRYSYFFVTLFVGSLGMFKLASFLFKNTSKKVIKVFGRSYKSNELLGLLSSLFYIFNLGTLQIFYVPFEMFNTQFMVLPWIFYYALIFLKRQNKRSIFLFSLFVLLGTPQAYAPVLFYVLFGSLGLFLFVYWLLSGDYKKIVFKRSVVLVLTLLLINLFWILPNVYYIKNYSASVSNARINSLFSTDAFLQSSKWGTLIDFPILRGFLFGWQSYKSDGSINYLMPQWRSYMAKTPVLMLGLFYFFTILLGAFYSIYKKNKFFISILPVFFISLFMVIGYNTPLKFVWDMLRDFGTLLKEGLRFPWTKFSVLLQFVYSLYFSYGVYFWYKLILRYKKYSKLFLVLFVTFSVSLFIYMFPFFKGDLVSKEMQISLDPNYNLVYKFFENENSNTRIAYLPAPSLFGWSYYNWSEKSYQGAGFVWFGLAQSFLTRDFDRWHPANEQFYNEFQYAIYSENADLLLYLINKYQLDYLLLDKNVITPGAPRATFYEQTENLLAKVPDLVLDKRFGNIYIYNIQNTTYNIQSYVYTPESFIPTNVNYGFSNVDPFFYFNDGEFKDYIKVEDTSLDSNPIFSDDTKLANLLQNNIYKISLGDTKKSNELLIPNLTKKEPVPTRLWFENNSINAEFLYPKILAGDSAIYSPYYTQKFALNSKLGLNNINANVLIEGNLVNLSNLKQDTFLFPTSRAVLFSKNANNFVDLSNKIYSAEAFDCGGGSGSFGKIIGESGKSVSLIAKDKSVCMDFNYNFINAEPVVYKVKFSYKSNTNSKPLYCLNYVDGKHCLNQKYKNSPSAQSSYKTYEDYVYVSKPGEVYLSLILENYSQNEELVDFKDIQITQYKADNYISLAPNENAYNIKTIIELDKYSNYFVQLPSYGLFNRNYVSGDVSYNSLPKNCDNFNQKFYDRVLNDNYYSYTATDAISCDSINTSNVNSTTSWLFTFENEYISGKGLDICIAGTNLDKCLIQDRLSSSHSEALFNLDEESNVKTSPEIDPSQVRLGQDDAIVSKSYILPSYPAAQEVRVNISNQSIG